MSELLFKNWAETVSVLGLCIYFLVMAAMFIFKPMKYAEKFSVKPIDNAGITEIRVYYGGISFALAAFLAFLFLEGYGNFALVGGLIFSNVVFFTRLIFTFIDKGWKCPYTKLAIPAEACFVVVLWISFAISKTI